MAGLTCSITTRHLLGYLPAHSNTCCCRSAPLCKAVWWCKQSEIALSCSHIWFSTTASAAIKVCCCASSCVLWRSGCQAGSRYAYSSDAEFV